MQRFVNCGLATVIVGLVLVGCTPVFLAQDLAAEQDVASDATVALNLADAKVAALEYLLNNASLPLDPATDLAEHGWPQGDPVVHLVAGATGGEFCLWALSAT